MISGSKDFEKNGEINSNLWCEGLRFSSLRDLGIEEAAELDRKVRIALRHARNTRLFAWGGLGLTAFGIVVGILVMNHWQESDGASMGLFALVR